MVAELLRICCRNAVVLPGAQWPQGLAWGRTTLWIRSIDGRSLWGHAVGWFGWRLHGGNGGLPLALAEPGPLSGFEVWARAFFARSQSVLNRIMDRDSVVIQL